MMAAHTSTLGPWVRWSMAAMLLFAGAAKLVHPEEFGLYRLLGLERADPAWIMAAVSLGEIAIAAMLVLVPRAGLLCATVLSLGFCVYHIGIGIGLSAPT